MCVEAMPPMSAATALTASSSRYQAWSTGSADSSNAAVARRRNSAAWSSGRPPSASARSASASRSGPNSVRAPRKFSSRRSRSAVKNRRSAVTSIDVKTRNGLRASSDRSIGRNAVEITGTELEDASRRS